MTSQFSFSFGGFAGTRALSWRVWLIAGAGPELLLTAFGNFGPIYAGALATASALVLSLPIFLVGNRVMSHGVRSPRQRAWSIFGIFVATSALASLGANFILSVLPDTGALLATRVVAGAIFHLWFYLLVAEIVNDHYEFTDAVNRLETIRSQLEQVSKWRATNVLSARETEIARINRELSSARNRILEAQKTGASLRDVNEEVIRTLLAEMDSASSGLDIASFAFEPDIPTRRTIRRVFTEALRPETGIPIAAAAFIATTWVVTGLGMQSLFITLVTPVVGATLLWLFLKASNRLLLSPLQKTRRIWQVLGVFASWLVSSAVAGVLPVLLARIPSSALLAIGVQTTLVIFVFAMTFAYRRLGIEISNELEQRNADLEREVAANNSVLRVLRERLRRFVHGDLQNVLVAIERRLAVGDSESGDVNRPISEELEQALSGLEHSLVDTSKAPSPRYVMEDLKTLWKATMEIDFRWSSKVESLVESSAVTKNVIAELLMEIITNTAKHDQATRVSIEIEAENDLLLRLRLDAIGSTENDIALRGGHDTRLSRSQVHGNGQRLFNEVCLSWSLATSRGETTFLATVPMVTHPVGRDVVLGGAQ